MIKMLKTRQYGCFDNIRRDTNISSLAPGFFAGARAGVRVAEFPNDSAPHPPTGLTPKTGRGGVRLPYRFFVKFVNIFIRPASLSR